METHDIIGKRFGKLIVCEYLYKKQWGRESKHYYKCKCDCGGEKTANRNSLLMGGTESCGCLRRRDCIGKRFGKLVVGKFAGGVKKRKGAATYVCRCDCGKSKIVQWENLQQGHTRSCGCLKHKKGKNNKGWKGHEGISGRYWAHIRCGAKKKKFIFCH